MVKPVPPPPDYTPSPEVADIVQRMVALEAPDGASPERHVQGLRDLQYLWQLGYDRWSRQMAHAQACGVSHSQLSEATGYSNRKASQRAVYRGRDLISRDALRDLNHTTPSST